MTLTAEINATALPPELATPTELATNQESEFSGSNEPQCIAGQASIYGSFLVGSAEFALSVNNVQEVVNEPDTYSQVPLAPDYLLGLFNLRGIVIPVVDMRSIFEIEEPTTEVESANTAPRKIAVIEHGSLCIGLLFDATCEVFNGCEKERCQFSDRTGHIQRAVIEGVFKMNDGRRIVQILDVKALLNLDSVPHSDSSGSRFHATQRRGPRRQCISFTVGNARCALNIEAIKEIINIGAIENTMLAGELCLGAIDIRGNTVPILNFSGLLGYSKIETDGLCESDATRVIVMKVDDHLFGLLVSSINSIISYFDDELIPFPVLGKEKTAMFAGCVVKEGSTEQTVVLKHDEILSSEEIAMATQGHSKLFTDKDVAKIDSEKKKLDRKTLLTFSLTDRYGLDINEVKEVIEMPTDLVKTPKQLPHILGMVNLRGELVAIINAHALYQLDEPDSSATKKVLVFESNANKYGLVVDSVDSIIPFSSADAMAIPSVGQDSAHSTIGEDVKQAIMLPRKDGNETICILDLEAVSRRATA